MKFNLLEIIQGILWTIGVLVFSQGVSFARLSHGSMDFIVNIHAFLISVLGVGFIVVAFSFGVLKVRIAKLEESVEQLKNSNKK